MSPARTRRVLILGYRKGLRRALTKMGIPVWLWGHCPVSARKNFEGIFDLPIPTIQAEIEAAAKALPLPEPITHVIAGTEEVVFAASIARRALKARQSKDTVVLKCQDKVHMKTYLSKHQVPMTPFIAYRPNLTPKKALEELGVPVVVKPRRSSGGRGIQFAWTPEEIKRYLRPQTLVERHVNAPEGSVESFVQGRKIEFTNVTQYLVKKHINLVPGHYDTSLNEKLLELNQKVITALGIEWGLTHMEFYLTNEGPLFGEIALRPPGGYLMDLMGRAYEFDPWEAFVSVETKVPFSFPKGQPRWTCAVVIHPGAGTVESIVGKELVENLPQTHRFRLRVEPGDRIEDREGVGQEVGHLLLEDASPEALRKALGKVQNGFQVRLKSG